MISLRWGGRYIVDGVRKAAGGRPRTRAVGAVEAPPRGADEDSVLAAMHAGDEPAFAALVERHRRELQVHCYRMLGSFEDAEDLVQETFLRAWRKRASFTPQGPSSFRAWLYRIATNACLDVLERIPRRVLPPQTGPAADPRTPLQTQADRPWLQPYPDHLLEAVGPRDTQPDEAVVSKETIELAFLAAIQLLPPRQRAALILRDVLGWSAKETALLLEGSVASANSALQRARATMKDSLPARRLAWKPSTDPNEEEQEVLRRYINAYERGDAAALAEVLREEARLVMPPFLEWYEGRKSIVTFAQPFLDSSSPNFRGHLRGKPTRANRQPAVAWYIPDPANSKYRALSLDVLRIENGKVLEIAGFVLPNLFPAFGLPPKL
jgi:RNA polymerase sigma-70 factor, ECF subfamily